MADIPVLVCTAGALSGRRIPVPEGGIGIGRSPENAVVVVDEGVSRFHARLLFENGSLWLQDAGSRNGVFVNGARVTGHKALKVGDSMTIALHTFELRWEEEGLAGAAARGEPPGGAASAGGPPGPSSRAPTLPPTPTGTSSAGSEDGPGQPPTRRRWFWPFS